MKISQLLKAIFYKSPVVAKDGMTVKLQPAKKFGGRLTLPKAKVK